LSAEDDIQGFKKGTDPSIEFSPLGRTFISSIQTTGLSILLTDTTFLWMSAVLMLC